MEATGIGKSISNFINSFSEKQEEKERKVITVDAIEDALNQLQIPNTSEDIVYYNRKSIEKSIKDLYYSHLDEIKNHSYAIVNIGKNKMLSLYYKMNNMAFMNIVYGMCQRFEVEASYSFDFYDEDDILHQNDEENIYLMFKAIGKSL